MAAALQAAAQAHRAGQLAEAEAVYRQVLDSFPDHAPALHLLSIAEYQQQRLDSARSHVERAAALDPENVAILGTAGMICMAAGAPEPAVDYYRRALVRDPRNRQIRHRLASLYRDLGKLDAAVDLLTAALQIGPPQASDHFTLANALLDKGDAGAAIPHFRAAIALQPSFAEAHGNLGNALQAAGDTAGALAAYRQALALKPDFAHVHNNLGSLYHRLGQHDLAAQCFRTATTLEPSLAEGHCNLGNALQPAGDTAGALAAYRQALALKPDLVPALNGLGRLYRFQGLVTPAIEHFRTALAFDPAGAETHANLAVTLTEAGRAADAEPHFHECLRLDPEAPAYRSIYLHSLHFFDSFTPQRSTAEHRRLGRLFGAPAPADYPNDRTAGRPLRVGYVSADFMNHAVAYLIGPVLAAHDRAQIEVTCYANVARPDAVTRRLQSLAHRWRDIYGLPDDDLSALIQRDQIDILVDLSGHTAGNRLPVFARKPAPVQVAYLGYPDTTGIAAIDYRITDVWKDPKGVTEVLFTETLVRLPHGCNVYQPSADAPPVAPDPPVQATGSVTFGCFTKVPKLSARAIALWSRILHAVPRSRLILKAKVLVDGPTRDLVAGRFAAHGVAPDRLVLYDFGTPPGSYLQVYNQVDVALDPFPLDGELTTYDAIWMGVPIISLAGDWHGGRMGVSILSRLGLPDLIAGSEDNYLARAVALAGDVDRLRDLRATLRDRFLASPLADAPLVTRSLEHAYHTIWQRWCESGGSAR